ncbi:MAG: TlpA disulfide reductase family protein [Polyangiaceae bacterium]|nr:TlpA disulfide reductase family protein [Polyangiaceae bacterium]
MSDSASTPPADPTPAVPAESVRKPAAPRRKWLSWLGQVLLLVVVYFGVSAYNERDLIAGTAPGFVLSDLDGKPVSLESFRGKRVLLHFWATWCGVCRREFGALNDVAAQAGPDAVVLSVVSDADDVERLRQFAKEHDIHYPVLLASDRVVSNYAVRAFPTNYFLSDTGKITSKTVGMSTRWGMRARLAFAR